MFTLKKVLSFAIFISITCSCASVKIIKEETAPGTDIAAFKTYNYYSFHAAGDTTPRKTDLRMSQIRKAISNELNQKGYVFSANNPDLLVNVSINVKQDVQTREKTPITDQQTNLGQPNYNNNANDVVVGYYKTGIMQVDIVDSKKNTLVWQNISDGVLADKEKDIEKRMQERFKKVFEHFPHSR
jgi:hypothetical protein